MTPQKEYALFCEFATMSVNGLQSYMHVFDRTTFQPGTPVALRGYFATRLVNLPAESETELYVTDGSNTLVDGGALFKNKIKGPSANIVARIPALAVKSLGEYKVWARVDGGEPVHLCSWDAVLSS
ncbi:MAG: hypothetical protein WC802_01245 [Patescibacteria group bacterium]|jgi:hypothetical protein